MHAPTKVPQSYMMLPQATYSQLGSQLVVCTPAAVNRKIAIELKRSEAKSSSAIKRNSFLFGRIFCI